MSLADLLRMPEPGACDAPLAPGELSDGAQRRLALDVERSWIVEAPAGSGKTGLLIQRYLRLLASDGVDAPEEVLAITFTKAATAEIRERVMAQLRAARAGSEVKDTFAIETRAMAQRVLERDREREWRLLDEPERLRVRTIDALCGEIARSLPVLSGGGSTLTPVEQAGGLYEEAARRTWLRLGESRGGAEPALDEALQLILLHRDGDLGTCVTLVAEMLGTRDQWGELIPLRAAELTDEGLEREVRPRLDRALEGVVCSALTTLARAFPPGLLEQLAELAAELAERPGYRGRRSPLEVCRELRSAPRAAVEHLAHWRALAHLLVTPSGGAWRSGFRRNHVLFETTREDIAQLKLLVAHHQANESLLAALNAISKLPPTRYPEEQWVVAKALFRILRHALVELQVIFAERGECDFLEPALLAGVALERLAESGREGSTALGGAMGSELKHLLVDEMQDTSTRQYALIERLTAGWAGERKTVFLVGDPKQSIYLFRQARVERFLETMRTGRLGELRVGALRLTANFRSQAALVDGFNEDFSAIFGGGPAGTEAIGYTRAVATRTRADEVNGLSGAAWHLSVEPAGAAAEQKEGVRAQATRNAREIRRVIERWQRQPLPEGRSAPWKIAVLVQSRSSLARVLPELQRGEPVPFRAVDIDPLRERREVLDLLALTRALLHPGDRVAWLAVLHAPWCGLDLASLHQLTGRDEDELSHRTILDLMHERGEELGAESIARLERVWPVLQGAARLAGQVRTPELVERTWRSLGGDSYLRPTERANAETFLRLLRRVDAENGRVTLSELNARMQRLFAAPGSGPTTVDLMTIHGAKGLEWDVVLIPELERAAPRPEPRLLDWEELEDGGGVVLAPILGKGQDAAAALNRWIRGLHAARQLAERRRVFYVACTRAREELHLFGAATTDANGSVVPQANSLLRVAWPAAQRRLERGDSPEAMPAAESATLLQLAASGEEERPAMLERLPAGYRSLSPAAVSPGAAEATEEEHARQTMRFVRPEGSFAARSFGNAVHALLEEAARRLGNGERGQALLAELPHWEPRAAALLRTEGLAPRTAQGQAAAVRQAVERTLEDPVGRWILEGRRSARQELSLTSGTDQPRQYRMDRLFKAGAQPCEEGDEYTWIIDYKTTAHGAPGGEAMEEFLEQERQRYTGQMEAYALALGESSVRLGLWFPTLSRLIWWEAPETAPAPVEAEVFLSVKQRFDPARESSGLD